MNFILARLIFGLIIFSLLGIFMTFCSGCSSFIPTPHGYAVLSRDAGMESLSVETNPDGSTMVQYAASDVSASTATQAAGTAVRDGIASWFTGQSLLSWVKGQTSVGLAQEQTAQSGIAADAATDQAAISANAETLQSLGNNPEANLGVVEALTD